MNDHQKEIERLKKETAYFKKKAAYKKLEIKHLEAAISLLDFKRDNPGIDD